MWSPGEPVCALPNTRCKYHWKDVTVVGGYEIAVCSVSKMLAGHIKNPADRFNRTKESSKCLAGMIMGQKRKIIRERIENLLAKKSSVFRPPSRRLYTVLSPWTAKGSKGGKM